MEEREEFSNSIIQYSTISASSTSLERNSAEWKMHGQKKNQNNWRKL